MTRESLLVALASIATYATILWMISRIVTSLERISRSMEEVARLLRQNPGRPDEPPGRHRPRYRRPPRVIPPTGARIVPPIGAADRIAGAAARAAGAIAATTPGRTK